MLTDDTLRKVRETARIDEVASGYLTLHRSGKDFVALCPFHDERHPSFRVSPARNIGKCFSCGEAADPIRLVCHMEGCGFEEAVRLLARKYNIEVEETAAAGRERRRDEREALLLANASFASGLLPGHPVGTARTVEDRHGLEETYRGFGVGLCPPDVPQVFRPFLGRLIFPIHTTGGQVAGFAGRSLTPSEKGRKYVNSPDSPAYHKGHILYGLHKAVKAVRSEGRILLCEGYKDVLAFHACGIRYAVGLCGTALTEEHIRAIRRLAGQVTLSLDPDPAGRQNTVRCAHMLLSEGCAVSLLPLPDGMDPDEVYRRKGSDELARLAREGTLDYLSYRIRQAASRRDPLPSAPLRRVLRTPEASPGLGVRPHGGDTRRAPAPTSHARGALRPERPYRPGIAKPKYPAGGDIGGRQKKHYRVWRRTLLRWEANTVVSEAKHSSVRTGNTIVLLFHAIQPTLAGWRVHPNDKHHKYQ